MAANKKNILTYSKEDLIHASWQAGYLEHVYLLPYQKIVYKTLRQGLANNSSYLLNCSRRFGKTSILVLIAIEESIKTPDHKTIFCSQYRSHLNDYIQPIFRSILETCPPNLTPKFLTHRNTYLFPNKSEITLHGVNDKQADKLRGGASNLNILDEAGYLDELQDLLQSVLNPRLLTTNGKTLIASTPPKVPGHYYTQLYQKAKDSNTLAEYTIYDNKSLTPADIDKVIEECNGADTIQFRREYLTQFVDDDEIQIIPEHSRVIVIKPDLEADFSSPRYQHYISLDVGFTDQTAILFGRWDKESKNLTIYDEVILQGSQSDTASIATAIKHRLKPDTRIVSDIDNRLINDLNSIYHLPVVATTKTNLEAMVARLREFIRSQQLIIQANCKHTLDNIRFGYWHNYEHKRKFARSKTLGHFDALASLIYMLRFLDQHTSAPAPKPDYKATFISPHQYQQSRNPFARAFVK